jgi:hypothetical protein
VAAGTFGLQIKGGALCNETPRPVAFDSFSNRCRTCNEPIFRSVGVWTHVGDNPADGHAAIAYGPVSGKWVRDDAGYDQGEQHGHQQAPRGFRRLTPPIRTEQGVLPPSSVSVHAEPDDLDQFIDEQLKAMAKTIEQLHHDLADLIAENHGLRDETAAKDKRINGLEETVRALGGLDDTAVMPRTRSMPPPGPLRVADDTLLIRPLPAD